MLEYYSIEKVHIIFVEMYDYDSKKSLNIEGLGEKQLQQLWELNIVRNFTDIFQINLYKKEIIELEGWGELSFQNLLNSIEKSKQIEGFESRLSNPGYLNNAKEELINETRSLLENAKADLAAAQASLEKLK